MTRRHSFVCSVLMTLGVLLPTSHLIAGPPCDLKLLKLANPEETGYRPRTDSMCEGVYIAPTSGQEPSLEMVSLTQGALVYSLETDRILYVDIPQKEEFKGRQIRLQAVGREEGVHYRMDAILDGDGPFTWPLETVLKPEGLEDFKIGIYGWVELGNHRIFVPLTVSPNQAVIRDQAPINLIVKTPRRLDWMAWRFGAEDQPLGEFEDIARSDLMAGEWKILKIPAGEKKVLKVEVQGKPYKRRGNIWLPKTLVFRPGN